MTSMAVVVYGKREIAEEKKKRIKPKRWKRRRGEDRAMANSEFVRNGRASRIKNFLAWVNFFIFTRRFYPSYLLLFTILGEILRI